MRRTLAEVAARTGGRLVDATGAELVDAPVVIDSREVRVGSLFVALEGEHVDGHAYAAAAVGAGAAGVLAARPVGVPAVVVEGGSDGVVAALGRLAQAELADQPLAAVTAITGSSGKTSTKDLVAQVLPRSGPTLATPGSFNNELGLPLTVLRVDARIRHLVLEMGARGRGHVARLCVLAPPTTGAVLNVGTAHVGEFGSTEAIALAKRELVEALPAAGHAVLNADDPAVAAMASASAAPVLWFGRGSASADVTAERVTLDRDGLASFTLVTPDGRADVRLRLVGEHHVANALAAAAIGHVAGLGVDELADALGAAGLRSRWRMEVHRRADGVTVVNDAYNANPDSVRAALRALAAIGRGGRTWAVLGEMLELGTQSAALHEAVGRDAVRLGTTRLLVVGEGARPVLVGAEDEARGGRTTVPPTQVEVVPDRGSALRLLRAELRPGDTVLVKSSRDAGLRVLGDQLAADATAADEPAADVPAAEQTGGARP